MQFLLELKQMIADVVRACSVWRNDYARVEVGGSMLDLTWLTKYFEWRREILVRGRNYYNRKAVRDVVSMSEGEGTAVHAKVNGTKTYRTTIAFNRSGGYKSSYCSCPYNQGEDGDICKHIAALYLHLMDNALPDSAGVSAGRDFLSELFEIIEAPINKRNVSIEYYIEHTTDWHGASWIISMRIGIDKMYMIKNIKELIECMLDGGRIEFGKSFTYNTRLHSLGETDSRIFDYLIQLYNTEMAYKGKHYGASGSIFTGKTVTLGEELFLKFCFATQGRTLNFRINNIEYKDIKIRTENCPFSIMIRQDQSNGSIVATLNTEAGFKFLGGRKRFMVGDGGLFMLDNSSKSCEFLNIFNRRGIHSMEFKGEEKQKLLTLLPQLVGDGNISISEEILQNYVRSDLKANLFIDRHKRGISIRPEFDYAGIKINPFDEKSTNPYVIRDHAIENQIVRLIEDAEFKVKEDVVYLNDYDKIYLFFRDAIPVLMELCSVFYTNEVGNMYLGRVRRSRSAVAANRGNGLIDIEVELDGIDSSEISAVLKSIKERRNYHKLKSGQLLSLEGEDGNTLSQLMERIDASELEENRIRLSKYRAVGLFENIREQDFFGIDNTNLVTGIIDRIRNPELVDIELPEKFVPVLRDYQTTGHKWLRTLAQSGFAGILADDMGLGKTIQMISVLYQNLGNGTSIVIVPSSLIYNWESEIERFAPEIKTIVIAGNKALRQDMISEIGKYDLVITSYPLIRRDIELYEHFEFAFCILDEAQHIKNPDSVNSISVKSIQAGCRFALTGTPIENSLSELWSIFDFLMPGYLFSRNGFAARFEKGIQRDGDKDALQELRKMISPFLLRRKKKDVLTELPDKIETTLLCSLDAEQEKLYKSYAALAKEEISKKIAQEGFDRSRIQILSMITRLRQICCHPSVFVDNYTGGSGKMELLEELVEELIEGEHRILLFSQFTSLLELIRERLDNKGISYQYLDGSVPTYKRKTMVDSFNEGFGSVFLISLKAGGTGLNLTSADCVIHFDPWWNPAVEDQASDRAHRIGQQNVVEVFRLITKDTIEEKIAVLQGRKRELVNAVITEGETFLTKLTEDEIMELFTAEEY